MTATTTPKSRPLILPASRIRAAVEGRITQYRVPVTIQNSTVLGYPAKGYWPNLRFQDGIPRQDNPALIMLTGTHETGRDVHLSVPFEDEESKGEPSEDLPWYRVRPVFSVRDELWIKEKWQQIQQLGPREYRTVHRTEKLSWARPIYAAGYEGEEPPRWMPSTWMPEWASRLRWTIQSIRVERLQEISEEDCWAEGLFRIGDDLACPGPVLVCEQQQVKPGMAWVQHGPPHYFTYAGNAKQAFQYLWDGIHNPQGYCPDDAPLGWEANPWCWVLNVRTVTP